MENENDKLPIIKSFVAEVIPLSQQLPCDWLAYTTRRDQFYFIVKDIEPSTVEMKQIHEQYKAALRNGQMEMKPVVAFRVNNDRLEFGILIYWDDKKSYLNEEINWKLWNNENIGWFNMQIHARRMQIDFLPIEYMRVIKQVFLNDKDVIDGSFIYLRKFSQDYKMTTPSNLSDQERFDRLLRGTPEDEFPNDELDDLIFKRIKEIYPNAEKKSRLLLFHTDLLNLRRYKDFSTNTQQLYIYNGLMQNTLAPICIDCYYHKTFFRRVYTRIREINSYCECKIFTEYQYVTQLLESYSRLEEMNI